ncbi:hypothetical protein [Variovorax sp. KK3]|uniref:hypothetical protein n=1 Tax=Variovorax sp. KK3 TaxID=1855728 RepID=UPI00097C269E|nr:hypothetical protein [Variovorax sp. KK3]
MTESTKVFRRYTDLASLLDMLHRKSITLLRPDTWDDRNDRLMMETYANRLKLKTLLALCLTSRGETYHHWKVFTDKSNGVCIHFRRDEFKHAMEAADVKVEKVKYLKLGELVAEDHLIETLPFLKRFGFGDEGEYRAVYQNKAAEEHLKQVQIDLNIIERVSLNPWMPTPVFESVRATIEAQRQDASFTVDHSSLIDNRRWRQFASQYENKPRWA